MILFRADGNPDIGSGHIMRCLSIADAGYALGEPCLFVTADEGGYPVLHGHGHKNSVLHTDYKNMSAELEQMKTLINEFRPTALLVDSYYVTRFYLNTLLGYCRKTGCRLVYIDDIGSFAYPCDILVNYNIYGPGLESQYKKMYRMEGLPKPRFLLGTDYAPLRAEFQDLPERIVKRKARNILISTGGSDPEHLVKSLAERIVRSRNQFEQFFFHFIIGKMSADREEIEKIIRSEDNIFLHIDVDHMCDLMRRSDIAVSAAGFTLYELCAAQTPAVTYVLADNQILGADGFQSRNILWSAGNVRELGLSALSERLLESAVDLAWDFDERMRISKLQRSVIDGNGAKRLIIQILMREN